MPQERQLIEFDAAIIDMPTTTAFLEGKLGGEAQGLEDLDSGIGIRELSLNFLALLEQPGLARAFVGEEGAIVAASSQVLFDTESQAAAGISQAVIVSVEQGVEFKELGEGLTGESVEMFA